MPRTALPSSSLAGGAAEEGQSSRMEGFSTRVSSGDGNDGLNLEEKMTSLEALGFDKNLVTNALRLHQGNLDAAANYLMNISEEL